MRAILTAVLVLGSLPVFATQAVHQGTPQTCTSLHNQVVHECEQSLCQDMILMGETCVFDGAFLQNLQVCSEDNFRFQLQQYNLAHQNNQLVCGPE
jgi:hypothetical protein